MRIASSARGRLPLLPFAAGLVLSAIMVWRSQVAGDQLLMLARGWKLAFDGELVFLGMPMSGGGYVPGALTSLLVGLPLLVWPDPRAATLVVLGSHVLAYLLLDRVIGEVLGKSGRLTFAVFFWLNPWRLYHSAFLWTPNLMIALGALHFWTLFRLRERPRFWLSFLHVLVLGAAFQTHPSALLLLVSSLVLLVRGYFRLDWRGAAGAALTGALSLGPWYALVLRDPSLLPVPGDEPARLSRHFASVARGLGYWLRYSSFYLSETITCLDFGRFVGDATEAAIKPLRARALDVLGWATLLLPLWSNGRHWRRARRRWRTWRKAPTSPRRWLHGAISWTLLSAVPVFILSPTTLMSWQVLGLFHLAVAVTATELGLALRGRRRRLAHKLLAAGAAASLVITLAIAAASPIFRPGGDRCGSRYVTLPTFRTDYPMFDDLRIRDNFPLVVDDPDGWWLDLLEEDRGPGG